MKHSSTGAALALASLSCSHERAALNLDRKPSTNDVVAAAPNLNATHGVPLPGVYLSFAPTLQDDPDHGLIPQKYLRADGTVMSPAQAEAAVGDFMTPMHETERYYATVLDGYVPATLGEWKRRFGIPMRAPDEDLAAYRAANWVSVYYNKNELGLGRELGCGPWITETDGSRSVGCYVTNYGTAFGDHHNSLREAVLGRNPKNTVCIVYRSGLPAQYQVQFYAFDGADNQQDWAQLDTLGPRKQPQICTNCHGGSYDAERHLVRDSRFLPIDPNVLEFSTDPRYTRAPQEEAMRVVNRLAFGPRGSDTIPATQQLTEVQRAALLALYSHDGGSIETADQPSTSSSVPIGWNDTEEHRDLFNHVIKPSCLGCHGAVSPWLQPLFQDATRLQSQRDLIVENVCTDGSYSMPNAQQTMLRFWDRANPVTIAGRSYDSPADAFLRLLYNQSYRDCLNYAESTSCIRAGVPNDALCGNDHSGAVCTGDGGCFATLAFDAPPDYGAYTGVCSTGEHARGCMTGQECRPVPAREVPSYGGSCWTCGRDDQPACQAPH